MKFSIITPVHLWNQDRVDKFLKCIESVKNQTYRDFEWIVIDDGSTLSLEGLWHDLLTKNITLLHQPHNERIIAYNAGLGVAEGEWICFLDSDDEYTPDYLEEVFKMIKKYPESKMFNFGCKFIHKDGKETNRDPFEPKELKVGHEEFSGGNIVNGTFVFHRSIWEDLGAFPPEHSTKDCTILNYPDKEGNLVRDLFAGSPYDFSAYAQLEFPEIQKYYMVKHPDHPKNLVKELGNPWGNDYYLFYKYTRKYHSKSVNKNLYIVNLK